jgi:hypothetical protein
MARSSGTARPVNEGEGNKTAARAYNDAQRRFVVSGQVDEKAREAERALDGPEHGALEAAEAVGKSHAAEEDPQVAKGPNPRADEDRVRARAYEIWEGEGCPHGRDRDHWRQAEREMADRRA